MTKTDAEIKSAGRKTARDHFIVCKVVICGDAASHTQVGLCFNMNPPERTGQAQERSRHKRRQVQIILGIRRRQREPGIDCSTISPPNKGPRSQSLGFIRKP